MRRRKWPWAENTCRSTVLYGLSRLSVRWLRLGIDIERIKPGHSEQNGRHERMHLTLKTKATQPASANFLQQQARRAGTRQAVTATPSTTTVAAVSTNQSCGTTSKRSDEIVTTPSQE